MLKQFVIPVILCVIIILVGCEEGQRMTNTIITDPPSVSDREVAPHEAYLLSLSDNRPADVIIGWKHYVGNGCDYASGGTAERDGHHIYLTVTEHKYTGPNMCTQAVEEIYGGVSVKNLEIGEYIIKGKHGNTEIGRFRIKPDMGYSFTTLPNPFFLIDPITSNTDEQKGDTYQVTASMYLDGYYDMDCEPVFKIDVERTQDVIHIEAWQVISKKHCRANLDGLEPLEGQVPKQLDIALGTFSNGSYTVILNGIEYTFEVPPPYL